MNQWLNRSHPMTLQAGVILGYISAVFGLLRPQFFFILYLGIGAGAHAKLSFAASGEIQPAWEIPPGL